MSQNIKEMMVLCIDNTDLGLSITKGKWYKATIENDGRDMNIRCYLVLTDRGIWSWLDKKKFKNVAEIRQLQVNIVLDEEE